MKISNNSISNIKTASLITASLASWVCLSEQVTIHANELTVTTSEIEQISSTKETNEESSTTLNAAELAIESANTNVLENEADSTEPVVNEPSRDNLMNETNTAENSETGLTSDGTNLVATSETAQSVVSNSLTRSISTSEKSGFDSVERKYYVDGIPVSNKWIFDKDGNWYFANNEAIVEKRLVNDQFYLNDNMQRDFHINIEGQSYYFDSDGVMVKNKTVNSQKLFSWFTADANGKLTYEVTPWGHYINNVRKYDSLAKINNLEFYYEPEEYGGGLAVNKWSYSPQRDSWFFSNEKAIVNKKVTPKEYLDNGVSLKDSHISIDGFVSYYYDINGLQIRNKTVRSNKLNAWFTANEEGHLVMEVTPWGYYVNNVRQYDTLAKVNNEEYYFEPKEWGGNIANNKWSYSPKMSSWYYSDQNSKVIKQVTPTYYSINNVNQKDKHVSINGYVSYYYDLDGKQLRNKLVYSNSLNAWFRADSSGKLIFEVTPWGHYLNGIRQFDTLVKVEGKAYYYEPQEYSGILSVNKWAYSPKDKVWYKADAAGIVVLKDRVGPVLPGTVKLDNGQWRMFSLAQDNWESGCWLRTAASGINSAGGNMTPFTLIKDIKRTDDPRTGMLSHPSIVNNWNLGGVYSATWPEALVPVVKKYVPNAENLTGANFEQIKRELANGNTVQVYYSWVKPNIRLNGQLGTFYGSRDYHSVLLTGYNSTGFYYQEHWGNPRNNHFSYSKLKWQFESYGSKAISYRKTSTQP